jgi:xanthine dehydrogenase accessory factor
MLDLLNQILSRSDRREPLAVCTLVRTRGSTPQKTGAIMLVLTDGRTLGTIGGGCVEAEVRTRALQHITTGQSNLFTFQLNHDHGWDDGLVCGGSMDVAVQILTSPTDAVVYRNARDQLIAGHSASIAIIVADDHGRSVEFNQTLEPSPTLVIAGAGHVGSALAAVASLMDFSVIVIDDRADFATAERFPSADRRIGDVDAELAKLKLGLHSYVVIVTRGHRRDALALASVIGSEARYVGLIGSRRKILRIFSDLHADGVPLDQLERVHAPIGLNIGGITPGEIAVSIAAELIAVRRGSAGILPFSMQLTAEVFNRIRSGEP